MKLQDKTDADQRETAARRVVTSFGRLDVLVNNAGIETALQALKIKDPTAFAKRMAGMLKWLEQS